MVEVSRQVAGVSGRLKKIGLLASLLAQVTPEEIEVAVAFLSGAYRQQKLNVGYAALQNAASGSSAEHSSLELGEVDQTF